MQPASLSTTALKALIDQLEAKVLQGEKPAFEEAMELMRIDCDDHATLSYLLQAAGRIQKQLRGRTMEPCSLLNAKSGKCAEDCSFCAQSAFYRTKDTVEYPLMPVDIMFNTAKKAKEKGAVRFCLVTSGMDITEDDFRKVVDTSRRIVNELEIACDVCIGFLDRGQIRELKQAGVTRVNINLQSSEEFYPSIVTTHTWTQRLENLRALKEEGMELCSGGIIGMGETLEDRIGLAFVLAELKAEVVPVNILDPRPGTKLEKQKKIHPNEIFKTVAVYRFILPWAELKIAGGRESSLTEEEQVQALQCGGDGIISGGYLTIGGNSFEADEKLLKKAGMKWGVRDH